MALNYALIPAAGTGSRMGQDLPKQYRPVAGRPMLCHALETFAACSHIARIFVVLSAHDEHFVQLPLTKAARARVEALHVGGPTRHASVENALAALATRLAGDDWIMVHDAARPGLSVAMIERLVAAVADDAVGGLLALPVADTLKRGDAQARVRSIATLPREGLWAAQTPQMFRYAPLLEALQQARRAGRAVTDEASAIEMSGKQPLLVQGHVLNFKVTYPDDLALADRLFASPP